MDIYTINKKIEKLKENSEKWESYYNVHNTALHAIGIVVSVTLIIIGIILFGSIGAWILLTIGVAILIAALISIFIDSHLRRIAPSKIENNDNEIKCLLSLQKNLIKEKDEQESKNNLDKLLKYKELLDANVITQEEFETKKKELLKQ